jgi:hypothetical protein
MVLLSGQVHVIGGSDGVVASTSVEPGELFGVNSSIDGLPRHDGALTCTEVELATIDPVWFDLLLTEVDGLAVDVLRDLGAQVSSRR